jgi:hypothetical protein
MKQPPAYHLRINKAVDRFLLIELLKRLDQRLSKVFTDNCIYCGFGGPYLTDIQLIHEYFPCMKLYSIEQDEETHKRQEFHKPCSKVEIYKGKYNEFLSEFLVPQQESNVICWLDYTTLAAPVISDFTEMINVLQNFAVIRITVPAVSSHNKDTSNQCEPSENFQKNFGTFFDSNDIKNAFYNDKEFARFLGKIFKKAINQKFPPGSGKKFRLVSSSYYRDTTTMFSLTGILCISSCNNNDINNDLIIEKLNDWEFANELQESNDHFPIEINLPILSTKERLKLQHLLPSEDADIDQQLYKELGYNIGTSEEQTKKLLGLYAKFYRYYPYFIRGNP